MQLVYLVGQGMLGSAYFVALRAVSIQMLSIGEMINRFNADRPSSQSRSSRLSKVTKRLYAACSVSCVCLLAQVSIAYLAHSNNIQTRNFKLLLPKTLGLKVCVHINIFNCSWVPTRAVTCPDKS